MTVISHSVLLPQLLDRSKTQTIRPIRSDHWLMLEPGHALQHYWKLRKPRAEKKHHFLGESVVEMVRPFCFVTELLEANVEDMERVGAHWAPHEMENGTYVPGYLYCPGCGSEVRATPPVHDFHCPGCGLDEHRLNGKRTGELANISSPELEEIAQRDGFESWNELTEWFDSAYNIGVVVRDFAVIRYDWKAPSEEASP